MADYFLQRHAWQLTLLTVGVAVVLGIVSFLVSSQSTAWFLRGVILGMLLLLVLVWMRADGYKT